MSTPTPREPGIKYDTKVMNLIVQDRKDRKKYEKMLEKGWEVELVQPRRFWRGSTYTFRRRKG
ncbi:hypothetical protein [Brevibacterium moorei]|uniref:hypothetical protein n=1 Tax=Brevibacterium moorei TaxID=2968457 RepID=UPI00211CC74E|nr:hypothetical protein [Brevibacterium sp. 68QC2CO]MCQ9384426.1 hypothetical protein [Brevibacterium sp. 68QC2CO]